MTKNPTLADGSVRPPLWTKNFIILTAVNMSFMFGFSMMPPTLPLYITDMGGSKAEVGAVAAAFSIAAIVTRFFTPVVIAKFGKRRMLLTGIALTLLVTFLCGFAQSVVLVLVFRVFPGIGFGFVSTLTMTLAADLLPDERSGEGIGYYSMGITVIAAISPALGLFLIDSMSFFTMFLTASFGQDLSVALMFAFRPPSSMNPSAKREAEKLSLRNSFLESALVTQCVMLLFMGAARGAEQNFITLLAKENEIGNIAGYFVLQTSVSFFAKFLTGRMYDSKGPIWSVVPGALCWIVAFAIMSYAYSMGVLLVAGFFSGAGLGLLQPAMQTWCVTKVGAERHSVGAAMNFNYYDIGIGGGALILGFVFERIGAEYVFRIASLCMVFFLVACFVGTRAERKRAQADVG